MLSVAVNFADAKGKEKDKGKKDLVNISAMVEYEGAESVSLHQTRPFDFASYKAKRL